MLQGSITVFDPFVNLARRDEMEENTIADCPLCRSGDIVRNITMSQPVEVGSIGLEYKTSIIRNTEPLLADLCRQCGTVVRLHVKHTDRKWVTKP